MKTQEEMDFEIHQKMLSRTKYSKNIKYIPSLSVIETERAIKEIKWFFQNDLSKRLNLERKTSPIFALSETGINDELSGTDRPVSFEFKCGKQAQIIHSLTKWKRMILHKYKYSIGSGIYTDMNAIRRDEDLSLIHSYYVDQWDWELVIDERERTIEKLKDVVRNIYESIKALEKLMEERYSSLKAKLPKEIVFVTTQELEDEYPELTPKDRENEICKKHGAVFLMQVGKRLKSGSIHDSRAPDYDDWELNGDILVYYDVLDMALEVSSMGIRVDSKSLSSQLKAAGKEEYMKYEYHQMIESSKYPLTIGGGIGQSRICMFILNKLHVGEVQSSIWSDKVLEICKEFGIELL